MGEFVSGFVGEFVGELVGKFVGGCMRWLYVGFLTAILAEFGLFSIHTINSSSSIPPAKKIHKKSKKIQKISLRPRASTILNKLLRLV